MHPEHSLCCEVHSATIERFGCVGQGDREEKGLTRMEPSKQSVFSLHCYHCLVLERQITQQLRPSTALEGDPGWDLRTHVCLLTIARNSSFRGSDVLSWAP